MTYILGLILILGLIFYSSTGANLIGDLWHQATEKLNGFIFPKSDKEILIDNIDQNYSTLDNFFRQTAPSLLESSLISNTDKNSLKQAVQVFEDSKKLLSSLKVKEKEDQQSITKALINKILKNDDTQPEPTYIPPNCNLVCNE